MTRVQVKAQCDKIAHDTMRQLTPLLGETRAANATAALWSELDVAVGGLTDDELEELGDADDSEMEEAG